MSIPPESQLPLANELIGVQAGDEAVAKLPVGGPLGGALFRPLG